MNIDIHDNWKPFLKDEFSKDYFKKLTKFIDSEYENNNCFPAQNQIFNAFNFCLFDDVKIVILGQDPYHAEGQANGLCFSVNDNIPHPPSLNNIFKELEKDLGIRPPESGNLIRWAKQGVLLLNTTLTVREGSAGSHQKKGWEQFTDHIIKQISNHKEFVVFLLWGGFSKKKSAFIDATKHEVLMCGHPSPLSANRGFWFGNKHFSKTNFLLEQKFYSPVQW